MRCLRSLHPLEIELLSDEMVTVRPFDTSDRVTILRGRDSEAARICVAGRIVGRIDFDDEREWLGDDEVNVAYNVFADDRGNGYATRSAAVRRNCCVL